MSVEDPRNERFIPTEFLFAKNGRYKAVGKEQVGKQVGKYPVIDVRQIDCNKIKLDNEFRIHFDNFPCDIGIRNFEL